MKNKAFIKKVGIFMYQYPFYRYRKSDTTSFIPMTDTVDHVFEFDLQVTETGPMYEHIGQIHYKQNPIDYHDFLMGAGLSANDLSDTTFIYLENFRIFDPEDRGKGICNHEIATHLIEFIQHMDTTFLIFGLTIFVSSPKYDHNNRVLPHTTVYENFFPEIKHELSQNERVRVFTKEDIPELEAIRHHYATLMDQKMGLYHPQYS